MFKSLWNKLFDKSEDTIDEWFKSLNHKDRKLILSIYYVISDQVHNGWTQTDFHKLDLIKQLFDRLEDLHVEVKNTRGYFP